MKIIEILKRLHKHDWKLEEVVFTKNDDHAIYVYRCHKCGKVCTTTSYIPEENRAVKQ